MSQPALSQQIAKLEKELGQPLFERQGRSIELTAAGLVLQQKAETILQLVEDAKREITDDGMTGRISLSGIPTIAPYLIPSLLKEVGEQFPHASFVVNEDSTESLLKRCAAGDIDIGLIALPADAKYLTIEPLFDEELVLAMPADHPLATRPRITREDIQREPMMMGESQCRFEETDQFCPSKNIQFVSACRIDQLATVQQLVAHGHGLALIPRMAIRDSEGDRLQYRSIAGDPPMRTIALCHNPYRYQSQLLVNFLKGIREILGTDFSEIVPSRKLDSRRTASRMC